MYKGRLCIITYKQYPSYKEQVCHNRYIFKSPLTVCFVRNEKLAAGFEEKVEMCCCWFCDSNRTDRRVLAAGRVKMLVQLQPLVRGKLDRISPLKWLAAINLFVAKENLDRISSLTIESLDKVSPQSHTSLERIERISKCGFWECLVLYL